MTAPSQIKEDRQPLSRERILASAVALADREGIAAVTMRRLAEELDVEAMSLYYHVASKEALLDGVVDVVVEEVNREVATLEPRSHWKQTMRERVLTAREVMFRHRWAPAVIETRTTLSVPVIAYFEGLLAIFKAGGFSYDLAHHALHAMGSRPLGFTQELFDPGDTAVEEDNMDALDEMADQFPHLVGMLAEITHDAPDSTLGWCDDQTEFEFGLDLILDGLETLRAKESTA